MLVSAPRESHVQDAIATAGALLRERAGELAPALVAHVEASLPPNAVRSNDAAQAQAAARALMLAFAKTVSRGTPPSVLPTDAVAHAEAYVHRGLSDAVLLRSYRLAHQYLSQEFGVLLEQVQPEPAVLLRAADGVQRAMFEFIDIASGLALDAYGAERERWIRTPSATRAKVVGQILAGEAIDVQAASSTLGYDLERTHVGLVLWHPSEAGGDRGTGQLERQAREIIALLTPVRPLVLSAGAQMVWAWGRVADAEDLERAITSVVGGSELGRPCRWAIGEPARGVEGFRTTHHEAVAARRLALATSLSGSAVRWHSVSLAAMLLSDRGTAQRFVERELGELGRDSRACVRLRRTLAAFFLEGDHGGRAARRLGVHQNTVTNRLAQCEELLGRSFRSRRLELHVALMLKEHLVASEPEPTMSDADEP